MLYQDEEEHEDEEEGINYHSRHYTIRPLTTIKHYDPIKLDT